MPNETNRERFDENVHLYGAGINWRFDPRYPEVRAYWVEEYLYLLDLTGCDGFKIDFICSINSAKDGERDDPRRDFKSVAEATDAALAEICKALRKCNPDILIEFRQNYNGPHMLQHCTMVRAMDCGNSYPDNRLRTCDVRLLSGSVPVHSDPIIWHPDETVENAALQLQHTLFSVPQLSVRLETLPVSHIDMIRTYMKFWRQHRDVILEGEFMPMEPQDMYPCVMSLTSEKLIIGVFAITIVQLLPEVPELILIVNATHRNQIVIEIPNDAGDWLIDTTSVTGSFIGEVEQPLHKGLTSLSVPPSGYALCRKSKRGD
jgi:alpha-galactosidase